MSAISWAAPGDPFARRILPLAPIGTATRLGMVCPARKFRFDANGVVVPSACAVMKPLLAGEVTVTFMMTAAAPAAGIPEAPAICTAAELFAATGPGDPTFNRVSSTRPGARTLNAPGTVGVPARK